MELCHEVELQALIVVDNAKKIGNRLVGLENHGLQAVSNGLELFKIRRRLKKHEVDVQRRHGSAVKGSRGIAHHYRFQAVLRKYPGNPLKQWFSIHDILVSWQCMALTSIALRPIC